MPNTGQCERCAGVGWGGREDESKYGFCGFWGPKWHFLARKGYIVCFFLMFGVVCAWYTAAIRDQALARTSGTPAGTTLRSE